MTITTRRGKGSVLTHDEVDDNWEDLDGRVKSVTVTLTAAQIAVLNAEGVEIVSAQDGVILHPIKAFYLMQEGLLAPFDAQDIPGLKFVWGFGGQAATPLPVAISTTLPYHYHSNSGSDAAESDGPLATSEVVNKALVLVSTGQTVPGTLVSVTPTVGAEGSGFAVGDTGNILGSVGVSASYEVLDVGGSGELISVAVIDTPGAYYSSQTFLSLEPGGAQPGVGIEGNVDTTEIDLSVNPNSLKVKLLYVVVPAF